MVNIDLKKSSYIYNLPKDLIANRPCEKRDESRLLYYDHANDIQRDCEFKDIINLLPKNALIVANQSKVFPCRLFAKKTSGAGVEIFFLSIRPNQDGLFNCMIKSSSKKKVGDQFVFNEIRFTLRKRNSDATFDLSLDNMSVSLFENLLFEKGSIPIPPYIRDGISDEQDKERYQTVFAKSIGSVAAPTAGLHFTDDIFDQLTQKGIDQAFITLHVGLGTFAPVKEDDLSKHIMHTENYFIDEKNSRLISDAYKCNRPIIAVGTTTLRALESSFKEFSIDKFPYGEMLETNIFLHPGKRAQSISGLITNFHLPESTLLMLVSSLIGRNKTLELYRHAVRQKYRFFSYGDANLILL